MTYTGHHDAIISSLRSDLAAANAEIEQLKADVATYVAMATEHAGEITRLRAALTMCVEDATRWRVFINSGRLRVMGAAGFSQDPTNDNGFRHIGLEIWNIHPAPTTTEDLKFLLDYIDGEATKAIGGSDGS